ncbi:hypothetical protein PYCC9005_000460 [Savitreella phatthalungensis]
MASLKTKTHCRSLSRLPVVQPHDSIVTTTSGAESAGRKSLLRAPLNTPIVTPTASVAHDKRNSIGACIRASEHSESHALKSPTISRPIKSFLPTPSTQVKKQPHKTVLRKDTGLDTGPKLNRRSTRADSGSDTRNGIYSSDDTLVDDDILASAGSYGGDADEHPEKGEKSGDPVLTRDMLLQRDFADLRECLAGISYEVVQQGRRIHELEVELAEYRRHGSEQRGNAGNDLDQ